MENWAAFMDKHSPIGWKQLGFVLTVLDTFLMWASDFNWESKTTKYAKSSTFWIFLSSVQTVKPVSVMLIETDFVQFSGRRIYLPSNFSACCGIFIDININSTGICNSVTKTWTVLLSALYLMLSCQFQLTWWCEAWLKCRESKLWLSPDWHIIIILLHLTAMKGKSCSARFLTEWVFGRKIRETHFHWELSDTSRCFGWFRNLGFCLLNAQQHRWGTGSSRAIKRANVPAKEHTSWRLLIMMLL